jgi:phytoene desaturase (3,4-didehydrolycopene-forming)
MSPFGAPGTYSLLQYTELAEGIWYPRGGFHAIVEALVNIGLRLGVTYGLSTPVSSVILSPDKKKATGVLLENGEFLTADIILLNCDLVYAYKHLLPQTSHTKRLSKRKLSCSSISFYWAMNRKIPSLTTHNIFLANDYRESFDEIFDKQLMPKEPSFYVNVPSRIDPTAAPEGKDAVVVLVPTGHLLDKTGNGMSEKDQDWEALVEKARQQVFDTVEARTGERGLREAVKTEIINTPVTWKEIFNLHNGAILGLSHSFL